MPQRKFDPSVVLKIESILFALTDGIYDETTRSARPVYAVTVTDIRAELYRRYNVTQSNDKIRSILHAQDNAGSVNASEADKAAKIGKLTWADLWCINPSNRPNGKRRYFVVRDFGKSQVGYLLHLMRSTSSGGKAPDTTLALSNMLCEFDQEKLDAELDETPSKANPLEVRFADTLQNIEVLQQAINGRRPINYRYVTNDPDGIAHRNEVPLCMEINEGYPYVIECARKGFRMKRIDMMRDVEIGDPGESQRMPTDFETAQEQARAFARGAVNRMGGRNVRVKARCHNDRMRKYVRDIFGGKDGFRELPMGSPGHQDYEFIASYDGTKVQAIKWMQWFEVLEPKSLRQAVITAIKANAYGEFEESEEQGAVRPPADNAPCRNGR